MIKTTKTSSSSNSSSGGIGFCGLLTIVFIVLKLLHAITWSWWWVLAPLWGGVVVFSALLVFAFIVLTLADVFK